ncbi:hypothetical protein [Leptolyngbya sp. FACHB-711]|nr:hypothetical protein [Leptolyngbya sp. FACHB-711]MBD1850819.1 hypothetical protein [Cyanobacteria bacterium FACHB-502]MBD2023784.1 hypothetical protein [Leptolyngbya sp. FACHB-711]
MPLPQKWLLIEFLFLTSPIATTPIDTSREARQSSLRFTTLSRNLLDQ